MHNLKVGIIGAGLIGAKRAAVIAEDPASILVAVADIQLERARNLATPYGAKAYGDWRQLVSMPDIDAVVVAVPNAFIKLIVLAALKAGKHILCEKPFGLNGAEARVMQTAAKKFQRLVKVGFNHRFHPGIWKAHEIVRSGKIGRILTIGATYGHGGRKGMDKEWRSKKSIAGGGELRDQGVHLIDLMRWFAGEVTEVQGIVERKFWGGDVEDNAFAILKARTVTCAFHVSTTLWGNRFFFEVMGDKGFVRVTGLGRRYGVETLTVGAIHGQFNHVKAKVVPFATDQDASWSREWKNFVSALRGRGTLIGDMDDGTKANEIVDAIYRSAKKGKAIKLRI